MLEFLFHLVFHVSVPAIGLYTYLANMRVLKLRDRLRRMQLSERLQAMEARLAALERGTPDDER